jgi:predicted lipoprotein with Yx(FWY)xxD motif
MTKTTRSTVFTKATILVSTVVLGALLLTACASPAATTVAPPPTTAPTAAPPTAAPTAAPTEPPKPTTPPEASINIATDPNLGKVLVGNNDMTLYVFTKDTADKSNCSGKCITSWPPLLTQGSPVLGPGVDASMVGSAALPDGTKIVTYNHMPLYYFAKDTKAGDVLGQNVGTVWFVLGPDGKPIGMEAASATETPAAGASSEATINVATDPTLGKILVGNNGMTLYIFTKDTADKSNCSGKCITSWPPLLTQGSPVLGPGVDASMIGSAALPDGTKIVTYNHMPLYYFAKDTKAGDVLGQNVGSVWFVLGPDGKPIGMEASGNTNNNSNANSNSNSNDNSNSNGNSNG